MWKYYCFDLTRLFWPSGQSHLQGLNKLFLHNCDKLSRISSCLLVMCNHLIFLVRFGINKHLLIFSKTKNCSRPTGSCNFVCLWKSVLVLIYSKLHEKNHVITWTNRWRDAYLLDQTSSSLNQLTSKCKLIEGRIIHI